MNPGDTTPPPPRGRETAVIFAEVVGASELYARAGDATAHEMMERCTEKLAPAIAKTGARFVKRIGARLMVLADTADAGARTAVALQLAAQEFPQVDLVTLGLGIGYHYGPVIQNEADVFGDTVNTAARLVEKAARGQILLAAETAEQVGSLYRRSIRRLYAVQLKGLKEELALCEIVWRADEPATFYPFDALGESAGRAKLKLKYRGEKTVLRRITEALTIGRDPGCGMVIDNEHASRHHCTISRRGDHFVVSDKSTNGTFVTVEGEPEVMLQRDEFTLRKNGWISFGQPRSFGGETLQFTCD